MNFASSITGDDALLGRVVASNDGGRLRISLENSRFWERPDLQIRITMPNLNLVRLSRATRGTVRGFSSTGELDVEVTGAISLAGYIEAGDTRITASGASKVGLSGSANSAGITASGASNLNLSDFQARDAKVSMSGASKGTVNARGRLDVEVHGASRLRHVGNPTIGRLDSDGASSVTPAS